MKMYQVNTGYMGTTAYKIFEVEVERATTHFITIKGQKHKVARVNSYNYFAETREDALKWIEEQLTSKLRKAKHNKEQAEKDIAYYDKELENLKDGKF